MPSGIKSLEKSELESSHEVKHYDISGKRIYTPHKGLNIIDGKKAVINYNLEKWPRVGSVIIFEYCYLSFFGKPTDNPFFAPCGEFLCSVLRISLSRSKNISAPSIIWISRRLVFISEKTGTEWFIFQLNGISRNSPHNLRAAIRFLSVGSIHTYI